MDVTQSLDTQIQSMQSSSYALYNEYVNLNNQFIDFQQNFTSSNVTPVEQVQILNERFAIVMAAQEDFTASLNALSDLYDMKNINNPGAGFPEIGEKIIRVGSTFDVIWRSDLVPSINLFFMKGGQQLPITTFKEETKSKKSFVIDITHFSEEYVPCKVIAQAATINTIFDESPVFKVLKSN